MALRGSSHSVLVIDEDPTVLVFIGRLLDQRGMRALMARSASEALGIAAKTYVPIDLILANVSLADSSGPEAVDRVRELRPGLNALYMSARAEGEVIRIDLMHRDTGQRINTNHSFSEAVWDAAAGNLAAGAASGQVYQ